MQYFFVADFRFSWRYDGFKFISYSNDFNIWDAIWSFGFVFFPECENTPLSKTEKNLRTRKRGGLAEFEFRRQQRQKMSTTVVKEAL